MENCSSYTGGMASLAAGISMKKASLQRSYSDTNQQQFTSDKIPSQLRSIKPLSENLNPIEEESLGGDDSFFGRSKLPFSGFDQDNVIVPKTKQR